MERLYINALKVKREKSMLWQEMLEDRMCHVCITVIAQSPSGKEPCNNKDGGDILLDISC